ncbi:hypothetical protein GMORB2_4895 [Geosmithia morbida]|uniref:Uncharacterized protein n=1 Tax=Geosmithia morbida TaxID=1094350 RepID=A0A9P4YLW0_9HYPO|nr:uncharacterized protein GMORB2_4895 [Geosmithia morbida]KAF4119376.1 hypothetical protein GMORB2_4895 [Geosmithia morbida]
MRTSLSWCALEVSYDGECKVSYTYVYPDGRTSSSTSTTFCPASRHGQPCVDNITHPYTQNVSYSAASSPSVPPYQYAPPSPRSDYYTDNYYGRSTHRRASSSPLNDRRPRSSAPRVYVDNNARVYESPSSVPYSKSPRNEPPMIFVEGTGIRRTASQATSSSPNIVEAAPRRSRSTTQRPVVIHDPEQNRLDVDIVDANKEHRRRTSSGNYDHGHSRHGSSRGSSSSHSRHGSSSSHSRHTSASSGHSSSRSRRLSVSSSHSLDDGDSIIRRYQRQMEAQRVEDQRLAEAQRQVEAERLAEAQRAEAQREAENQRLEDQRKLRINERIAKANAEINSRPSMPMPSAARGGKSDKDRDGGLSESMRVLDISDDEDAQLRRLKDRMSPRPGSSSSRRRRSGTYEYY